MEELTGSHGPRLGEAGGDEGSLGIWLPWEGSKAGEGTVRSRAPEGSWGQPRPPQDNRITALKVSTERDGDPQGVTQLVQRAPGTGSWVIPEGSETVGLRVLSWGKGLEAWQSEEFQGWQADGSAESCGQRGVGGRERKGLSQEPLLLGAGALNCLLSDLQLPSLCGHDCVGLYRLGSWHPTGLAEFPLPSSLLLRPR